MKPRPKTLSRGSLAHSLAGAPRAALIQQHRAGQNDCRAGTCAAPGAGGQLGLPALQRREVTQRNIGARPVASALSQRGSRPATTAGTKSSYRVQTPIPMGRGNQQIRATVQGTPQVAGSIDLSAAGEGQ